MTPKPPSSSEGSSFPPRSRPNLGDLVKDTTELDLWAFDDLDPEEEAPKPLATPAATGIPGPRDSRKKKPLAPVESVEPPPTQLVTGKDSIRVDVSSQGSPPPSGSTAGLAVSHNDFEDLDDPDHWAEKEPSALSIHPSLLTAPAAPIPAAPESAVDEPSVESNAPVEEADGFSPAAPENAKPISLVLRLGLSKLEWLGLGALGAILLVGAGVVFFNSIHRLPSGTASLQAGDFPVKGSHVTILAAETFWRAPVSEGKNADTFRRGTQLLPVVTLTSSGGPAGVRVFFRDEEGRVMGDAVTRTIQPGAPLQIAATAGFEDIGMHAAYRTGQSKPWTIQLLEGPSETAANAEFKKLFEIQISTDRR